MQDYVEEKTKENRTMLEKKLERIYNIMHWALGIVIQVCISIFFIALVSGFIWALLKLG